MSDYQTHEQQLKALQVEIDNLLVDKHQLEAKLDHVNQMNDQLKLEIALLKESK